LAGTNLQTFSTLVKSLPSTFAAAQSEIAGLKPTDEYPPNALVQWWSAARNDSCLCSHQYCNSIQQQAGYVALRVEGYLPVSGGVGTIPIYSWWNPIILDNYALTNGPNPPTGDYLPKTLLSRCSLIRFQTNRVSLTDHCLRKNSPTLLLAQHGGVVREMIGSQCALMSVWPTLNRTVTLKATPQSVTHMSWLHLVVVTFVQMEQRLLQWRNGLVLWICWCSYNEQNFIPLATVFVSFNVAKPSLLSFLSLFTPNRVVVSVLQP
jgi:hypothetical protein